ncbi:nucleotidyltransferase family protein [Kytococcus sedentarius]|uniref:nucleotidyltransferase family protein n=1 Tax=Kytococcus sedentarius TaxID=1276 RepID=UPI00384B6ACE
MKVLGDVDVSPAEYLTLACAACQEVARRSNVDALFVKGVSAQRQFPLRTRAGSDVDVLVRPDHVSRYVDALQQAGWVLMRDSNALDLSNHAVVLEHPVFACTVDVHRNFPGFDADAGEVFDAMWQDREHVAVAGRPCDAPSRIHHGSLLIVNAARTAGSVEARQVWEGWSDEERSAARVSIASFKGESAAATQLPAAFQAAGQARYWQVVADRPTGTAMWLARLWDTPTWGARLRLLGHAALPPAQWGEPDRLSRRLRRLPAHWAKGLKQLPAAVRRMVELRRG